MGGGVVIVLLLLAFPVLVGLGTAVLAAVLGGVLNADAASRHEGSELLDTNR